MNKQKQLKLVNPILALLLTVQALSGMMHEILPKNVFEFFHSAGWLLVFLAAYHVFLNWAWVKQNFLKKQG
nr:hypothetical protein [uncultured Desulfobulbus sp.]